MKYDKRTGPILFSGISTNQTKSIAEHSFKVANLVILLGSKITNINLPNVITHANTHDWPESVLGNIPTGGRGFKQYLENTDIREVFNNSEEKVKKETFQYASIF